MWTLQFLGKLEAFGPLILRLMVGISFALFHGYGKLVPEGGFDGGGAFAERAKELAPAFLLYVAAWTEFLGGIAVLVGILTRWAAIGLFIVMLYAIFGVHWQQGFLGEAGVGGYEKAATYAAMCLAIMVIGPGSLSLDRMFFGKNALNE